MPELEAGPFQCGDQIPHGLISGHVCVLLPTSFLVFVLVFVLKSRLRQTVTDMQVTSFPPRWQSLLKMLTFSGSKVILALICTTPRDLQGGSMLIIREVSVLCID